MSETIGEMIIPGTYIEVRAEGLIGVSGIATGNAGAVGTASRGPLNEVRLLGSYAEAVDTFGDPDPWPDLKTSQPNALTLTRTLEQLFTGGASTVYAVRIAQEGGSPMATMSWSINSSTDAALFTLTATSPGTWANAIKVSFDAAADAPTLQLVLGRRKETFSGANAGELAQAIADGSRWVKVTAPADADKAKTPAKVAPATTAGGPDGVPSTVKEVKQGLALLAPEPVNLLVVGGMHAKEIGGAVLSHLDATESDGKERIAVLGAWDDDPASIDGADVPSSPRVVLVAPGILNDAGQKLPAPYAAAVVAGKLAGLAPHISLTNQELPVNGLNVVYTRAQQKSLLQKMLLVLHRNLGFRVLKGNTTDTGAFKQISVRRIVDFAKAGVRIGANPYIGRLNNTRVRAALKATLDGFLSSMVFDEMLTAYQLDVSATRAQEIAGVAIVTMTLQPTFSIDFVKVVMNLE
jgi:hypothetical protein